MDYTEAKSQGDLTWMQRLHVKLEGNVQLCDRACGFEAVLVSTLCPSDESFTSAVTIKHLNYYVSSMFSGHHRCKARP